MFSFPSSRRLHGAAAFAAVFDAKCRTPAGPMAVLMKPSGLPHCRLGLSVGRRCGGAVERQHFKRLLREAFRLTQDRHPPGFDVVVVLHPHGELRLAEYQSLLLEAMERGRKVWEKRAAKAGGPDVAAPCDNPRP